MQDVLPVVNLLYAAVTEPPAWRAAMEGVADLLGSDHALLWVGTRLNSQDDLITARVDHDDFARRQAAYEAIVSPGIGALLPVGVRTRDALIPDSHYVRDAHYNEVVRHVGGFHGIFARGARADAPYRLVACRSRRRGNFDRGEIARVELLMPHLSQVVALRRRLGAVEAEGAALAGLLDRLSTALFLADASGRPVFVNQAARLLFAKGGLDLRDDGLATAKAAETRSLRDAVMAVCSASSVEGRTLRLARAPGQMPLLATVLPLTRVDCPLPGSRLPRAAVFLTEPERSAPIDGEAVAQMFGLTPRETDVAVLVAEGLGPDRIAGRLDLGHGTVVTHLKRAFSKTGTHSQAALAALIGQFTKPMN